MRSGWQALGLRSCESRQWTGPLAGRGRNLSQEGGVAGDRGLGAFSTVIGVDKITEENAE